MVAPKPVGQFVNGHAVHARLSLVSAYPTVRTNQILRVAYLLHQLIRQGSLQVRCRERLRLDSGGRTGSARTTVAEACCAWLSLRVHRIEPPAPCIGRLGPSPDWA